MGGFSDRIPFQMMFYYRDNGTSYFTDRVKPDSFKQIYIKYV